MMSGAEDGGDPERIAMNRSGDWIEVDVFERTYECRSERQDEGDVQSLL